MTSAFFSEVDVLGGCVDGEMMIFVWPAGQSIQERTRFAGDAKLLGLCDATAVTGLQLGSRAPCDLCVRFIYVWQSHVREFCNTLDA